MIPVRKASNDLRKLIQRLLVTCCVIPVGLYMTLRRLCYMNGQKTTAEKHTLSVEA